MHQPYCDLVTDILQFTILQTVRINSRVTYAINNSEKALKEYCLMFIVPSFYTSHTEHLENDSTDCPLIKFFSQKIQ